LTEISKKMSKTDEIKGRQERGFSENSLGHGSRNRAHRFSELQLEYIEVVAISHLRNKNQSRYWMNLIAISP